MAPEDQERVRESAGAFDENVVWDAPSRLRGELFTEAQLLDHATRLGRAHHSSTTRGSALALRRRFREARRLIRQAYATLAQGAKRGREPSPAELWLLDNGHVVEAQLREIDEDLPWGYLVELPRMSRGAMRGYPLVYGLCLEYIRHTDCHIDFASLSRFVDAYQSERTLTIGELWAIPIMLRLGLVLAVGALASSEAQASDRDLAVQWAERLLGPMPPMTPEARERAREAQRQALADLERFRQATPPSDAFLVTLLKRLRAREDAPIEALDWIAAQTERLHTTPEELARRHHLRQAADQVSVGNAITSMRGINSLDWRIFFRATSHVEAILRKDPHDVYATMDDASRDRCRHAVEKLARRRGSSESEVAAAALSLAERHRDDVEVHRAHVGYYLLDDGRPELHAALSHRPRLHRRLVALAAKHAAVPYLGSLVLLTVVLVALMGMAVLEAGASPWLVAVLLPLLLLVASEVSLSLVNAAVVALVPPRILPKFDFSDGIPEGHATLVVVPTLLGTPAGLERLLDELEVRALANPDDHLWFALLTDFPDADAAENAGEAELLERARQGIERLNAGRSEKRYFLLHRRRVFDPHERRYMGWERKRGKLAELNRLLRGATDTSFELVTAPAELLSRIRYVITLDTDTELPLGVARRLVATLAHPLNRPWFDPKSQRVRRGHALIQPRVGISPMSARRSIFARLSAGPPGIDPYTTAVSDVYQDLFGEGSFVGKGIYDVDAFDASMSGRVPDNQLLSHDLFESIYARSALASDIEVLDEQPSSYAVAAGRQHRWVRGDWQLFPWLSPSVPGKDGGRRYDFRAFDAWRVIDNLRRSLVAPAAVLLAAITWSSGLQLAALGTTFIASIFVVPVFGRLVFALARSNPQLDWLGGLGGDLKSNARQAFLSLVFLLDQALLHLDAIVRALYRQWFSRRHLLEWASMREAASRGTSGVLSEPRLLLAAGFALFTLGFVAVLALEALPAAAPVLLLWMSSPWVAAWISRVEPWVVAEPWGPEEARTFRRTARKTWRFFERFVGEVDHHLPPDNYQEDPRGIVAHRTSPTNIGLYLLAVAGARDLGFITLRQAIQRWTETLHTVECLEKREGHVLNWYDTRTLTPLEPRYVSTVDSGNLAAFSWTFAEACRDAKASPCVSEHVFLAALDAARLAQQAVEASLARPATNPVDGLIRELEQAEASRQARPETLLELLLAFDADGPLPGSPTETDEATLDEFEYWLRAARRTLRDAKATAERELPHLVWLARHAKQRTEDGEHADQWRRLREVLAEAHHPRGIIEASRSVEAARSLLVPLVGPEASEEFLRLLRQAEARAHELLAELDELASRAERLVDGMDFSFLYDEDRSLFSIGFSVSGSRLDNSHYDLLASEARLASLVAIAKGDVPRDHWFRLGRLRAKYASAPGLLSWSGSMFEYLMPLLITRSYSDTLLDQTCHAVVERQIQHARSFGVPWGISEAAFNLLDLSMNYQYRAFGVPGVGLEPGIGEDLVVAPYATALAGLVRARAAAANFDVLCRVGLDGPYGFYESIDYTPSRLPPGRDRVVVKAFFAHHQGMTLVALANLLGDFCMQRRFHADPRIKACALLLEERIPARAGVVHPETPRSAPNLSAAAGPEVSEFLDLAEVRAGAPRGHLLGQAGLSAWVTSGGEGFLGWRGIEVQRFREEASLDCGGTYLYFQNLDHEHYWSSGLQPSRAEPSHYDVVFSLDKVEICRRDGDVETLTEITLSPEHPVEIRRVSLTNHGPERVRIAVTTFTELCLTNRAADIAHPAFQKLFIEMELLAERGALLAHRRKRSEHDPNVWVAQMLIGPQSEKLDACGTSRGAFLGRGGTIGAPLGLGDEAAWAGQTAGALDPALILRKTVEVAPGAEVRFSLVTALSETRAELIDLVELYAAPHSIPRAFEVAWADARVELRHLDISSAKAHRYQRLLSALIFPQPALRAGANPPVGTRGRDALWSQGISGDLPIVMLRLDAPDFAELCRDLLLAHEYWRLNGVMTDLLILNEEEPSYLQPVQDAVFNLIRSTPAEGHVDQRGGVFVRRAALIVEEDLQLITSAARAVLSASKGSLARQLRVLSPSSVKTTRHRGARHLASVPPPKPLALLLQPAPVSSAPPSKSELLFDNGLGGFAPEDGAYVLRVGPSRKPPQPWSNVMAGPRFGALVTESGSGFTWFENSQKNRLTPWSNDATLDPSGELFFVEDIDAGKSHGLTPNAAGDAEYLVRHGRGTSSFEHTRDGLSYCLCVAVDPADAVKVWHLSVENRTQETRQLRVLGYAEWVLGNHRETMRHTTISSYHPELRAILARNPFCPYPRSRAFLATTAKVHSATADRADFFGSFASRARPAALRHRRLSGRFGAGNDPCAALSVVLTLKPGETKRLAFVLGAGDDELQALRLAERYGEISEAEAVLRRAREFWTDLLGRVRVRTPDPAFDLLLNHWLLYQVLSCRFWGRSGFYQSGGAYGFRDQLQDSLALVHVRPDLLREHLLRSASRQFVEGDVQHWWHPDTGEGVRTRCSDDRLWLPWAALEYERATADTTLWEERVGFLQERQLDPGRDDLYSVPPLAGESASFYEHCVRAIEAASTRGPHGLPLIGAGDWNDGMNRIGEAGQGESVWLAWFLCHVLDDFAALAKRRGDVERASRYREERARLARAIDDCAWDGGWYRRATFDDGSPVGSHLNAECRIDAIAQSWAVISGAGNRQRASRALDASLEHLWDRKRKLMRLLSPPFEGRGPDPGYIASYPPGIRENGGQYTHGVLWTVLALLIERRGAEAYELLSELNPIHHTTEPRELSRYQVEPYALAADVYSEPPHAGRGGWTWYTGSASWMYRIGLEGVLGIQRRGNALWLQPCVPPSWEHFEVDYRGEGFGELHIRFENPQHLSHGALELELDGARLPTAPVPLPARGQRRALRVRLRAPEPEREPSQPPSSLRSVDPRAQKTTAMVHHAVNDGIGEVHEAERLPQRRR